MSKCKRAISLLLVVLMMLSLLPASALADDGRDTYSIVINYVFKDSGETAAPSWTATVSKGSNLDIDQTSPAVLGYKPDKEAIVESLTNIQDDVTYTVKYSPALVNFTVNHHRQNLNDDKYDVDIPVETEIKTGYTQSAVGKLAKSYTGFTALLYDETTKIAADGSTVIDIYYDRNYYLLSVDLDGGYGAEPVYARYGADVSISNPTKPGYTFSGWDKAVPSTMPAENMKLTANWNAKDSVNYTVVFWYENANDSDYSYAGSVTKSAAPGTSVNSVTFQNENFDGRDGNHFKYNSAKAETVTVVGDGSTVLNVYFTRNTYTLKFTDGTEKVLTCAKEEHKHTYKSSYSTGRVFGIGATTYYIGGCYPAGNASTETGGGKKGDEICGKEEHSHKNSCYGTQPKVVKEITAKYEQDIHSNFPIKDGNETVWWNVPKGTETYGNSDEQRYLGSIDIMPGEDITFEKNDSESGAKIYYYVETLNGTTGDVTHNARNYKQYKIIDLDYSSGTSLTYKEEFHPIKGFTQGESNPSFGNKDSVKMEQNNYLYYVRNSYNLKFFNVNTELKDQQKSVQYEAALKGYNFVPSYPTGLEENAYEFGGWYTSPGCYDGSKVDWNSMTMPAGDLMLYAKWTPKTHTVRTFRTEGGELINTWANVAHRSTIDKPDDPTNGNYTFVGWFYKENGVEKAFDFSMAITKDLDLYAKWSSNVLVSYTIKYQYEGTNIADATTGSALAGTSRTFDAKGGDDLYTAYRDGYFPETSSHNMQMSIDGENVYIFNYVQREAVPYTVKYVDAETGEELITAKTVSDNRKAVVTEKYEVISGYMPDAAYKRLVVSADEHDKNVIIFYYTRDTQHALVTVNHWIQTPDGKSYLEYKTKTFTGNIKDVYNEDALTINGFTFNPNPANSLEGHAPLQSGTLTKNGLELNLYYDRISYKYVVKHVDADDGTIIKKEPAKDALFGSTVIGYQKTKFTDYMPADNEPSQKSLTISTDNDKNVITFYYYKCFYVGHVQSNVLESTDRFRMPSGEFNLTAQVTDGYLYGGAFSNAACDADHVQEFSNNENALGFHPEKGKTYYIWEVDQKYLTPKTASVWRHVDGEKTVTKVYLLTVVDRLLYSDVGFVMLSDNNRSNTCTANEESVAYGVIDVTKSGQSYKQMYVKNGLLQIADNAPDDRDDGYIGMYKLSNDEFTGLKDTPIKYQPYWVTLDGIKVTGAQQRTCTYQHPATNVISENNNADSVCTAVASTVTHSLKFVASYSYDADPNGVEIPEETGFTVTVNDNGSVYDVAANKGDDLTGKLSYAGADGKLFAGWFTDENCTVPADLSNVQENMTVYAKYVSDSLMQFKFVQQRLFGSKVYLFTSIDSSDFKDVGFVINGVQVSADYIGSKYSGYSARLLFGSSVGKDSKLVVGSSSTKGMSKGDTITVTPYWVTADGTTVYGTARTLTYGRFGTLG